METFLASSINILLCLFISPLVPGIINKTKAFFAGRKGPPLLQAYFDILKLLQKGVVYSKTTTWIFKAGPVVGLSSVIAALVVLPFGGVPALISFDGDFIFFAGVLCLMRFFTVIAALDTGSSFEGMGASREVQFSALAEPALFLSLAAVVREVHVYSLTDILPESGFMSAELVLVIVVLFAIFLCENARIPFDDPNTHLELTMIHEVMVLDHSGVDFAFITYASSLKLWVLGTLIIGLIIPVYDGSPLFSIVIALSGIFMLSIIVGVVESIMARFRLLKVSQILIAASGLSIIAFIFSMGQ